MSAQIDRLLSLQDGVISRQQALATSLRQHDLRRLIRRREWAVIHPGVYVNHTGPLTWHQRAWAGVLLAWPAALGGESALRAADGPGAKDGQREVVIQVVVDRHRSRLLTPVSVRVQHLAGFEQKVLWNMAPPRLRYEEAALDVATAARSELDSVGALAKACQSRRTTARRLLVALADRTRVSRRGWIEATLHDIADGTCSVLEHGFLTGIERPHGLPRARRQVRATASVGIIYRDVQYGRECPVELDGRLFHESVTQRDRDFERDLDAAVDGLSTTRLSWGQVFDRPCLTTVKLVQILRNHGVHVEPRACGPDCPVAAIGLVA